MMRSYPALFVAVGITLASCAVAADPRPLDWKDRATRSTAADGQLVFQVRSALEDGLYARLEHFPGQWYGSTYLAAADTARGGPDWCRVGRDWQHPGQRCPSVRTFHAPRDGRATITGRVYKLHLAGDGVRVAVRHGQRQLWQAEIEGTDQVGVEPQLTVDLHAGDRLRFIVDRRKAIACDTTHWDPVVTYADGQRYQASQAFATRQGSGPWFYERLADQRTEPARFALRGVGPDLLVRRWALGPGARVTLGPRDALSTLVLAEEPDTGGLVLALDAGQLPSPASGRGEPWSLTATLDARGLLRLTWQRPGDAAVRLRAFDGPWTAAIPALVEMSGSRLHTLYCQAVQGFQHAPDLDLLLMAQAEWQRDDATDDTAEGYTRAANEHLTRAAALAADLKLAPRRLAELQQALARPRLSLDELRRLYLQTRLCKRDLMWSDPLVNFDRLLFCKRVPTSYSHLVMQYFGWRARAGGGLFVLERPGQSLAARDLLAGRLTGGNVLEPRLSYDGRQIVFSYVACRSKPYDPAQLDHSVDEGFYHVYTVNVDGTGLRQLTAGPYDDLMPTWLPDGGIAFCSTRRRGHARCFGGQFSPRWHVYTLHRVDADGGNLQILSVHDTNEWFPTVSHTGLVLYSRWDYIDRDAVTHQNLWATRPDGTNPFAVWGNAAPSPHCMFQAQPIPGSDKIVFTASAHHSITGGSIAVVDPRVAANGMEAITRITPEIVFPEAEGRNIREYYASPWPLSERLFLVSYSPYPLLFEPHPNRPDALGLYLLDARGNRELIYRDPLIGSETAMPLRPRPQPPVVSPATVASARQSGLGEMVVMDVYQGLGSVPRGTIRTLRIVQIFPKTTHVANMPPIGMAREENARAILGTVPVAADGSARFKVPALTPLLFQALDADGMAYQTMRSLTYVQPGERVSCVGCHENRMSAPPPAMAEALRRPAARIEPGPWGGRPFSYVEMVQPVLDAQCVRCHGGAKTEGKVDLTGVPEGPFTRSYVALCRDRNFWGSGTNPTNAAEALVPRFGGRNTIQITPPGGQYGARGSRLIRMLRTEPGHYGVRLSADELRRLATWIDMNAVFYGAYSGEEQARQLRGERIAMPTVQ
jgi:hypothetical protein